MQTLAEQGQDRGQREHDLDAKTSIADRRLPLAPISLPRRGIGDIGDASEPAEAAVTKP